MPALRTRHLRGVPGCFASDCFGTVDTCIALLGVVLRLLLFGSHLFDSGLTEEYNTWIILGNDFQMDVVFFPWFVSGYIFTSVYASVSSPEEYEKFGIFLGVDFRNYFRMQWSWFDSGYMFLPVCKVVGSFTHFPRERELGS